MSNKSSNQSKYSSNYSQTHNVSNPTPKHVQYSKDLDDSLPSSVTLTISTIENTNVRKRESLPIAGTCAEAISTRDQSGRLGIKLNQTEHPVGLLLNLF